MENNSSKHKRNEKGELVLSLDDIFQPWHVVFPGDKDWVSPYAEGYGMKNEKK